MRRSSDSMSASAYDPTASRSESGATVVVLDASRRGSLSRELERRLPSTTLRVMGPSEFRRAAPWDVLQRVGLVLVEPGATSQQPWSSLRPGAVHGLPVALLPSRPMSTDEIESARREGLSAVLTGTEEDSATLKQMLQSPRWFTSQIETVGVPEVMQLLAASGHSGVLSLLCPHCSPLADETWEDSQGGCTGDKTCRGFATRVYFENGRPIHAESASQQGLPALAAALELPRGIARFLEIYIPPAESTLCGSLSELMLQASFHSDETSQRDSDPFRETPKTDMSRQEHPPRAPLSSSRPSISEQLRSACPQARVVVHSDERGSLIDAVGDDSAEGVAAVAAMMSQAFRKAAGELGLGELEGWTLVSETSTCVAASVGDGLTAAIAAPSTDAFRQLEQFVGQARDVFEKGGDRG